MADHADPCFEACRLSVSSSSSATKVKVLLIDGGRCFIVQPKHFLVMMLPLSAKITGSFAVTSHVSFRGRLKVLVPKFSVLDRSGPVAQVDILHGATGADPRL